MIVDACGLQSMVAVQPVDLLIVVPIFWNADVSLLQCLLQQGFSSTVLSFLPAYVCWCMHLCLNVCLEMLIMFVMFV